MKKLLTSIILSIMVTMTVMPLTASAAYNRYAPCDAVTDALETFHGLRETYQNDETDSNREALQDAAASLLHEIIQCNFGRLDFLEEKVQNNDPEYKNEILAEIDATRTLLENLDDQIDSIESKEDFQVLRDEIRDVLKDAHIKLKKYLHKRTIARLNKMIERGEKIADRISNSISTFQDAGLDTTTLEGYLESFQEYIDDAKGIKEEASTKLAELENATTREEAQAIIGEARVLIQDAIEVHKKGKSLLNLSIIPEIKSLREQMPSVN